ncbi:hypothetical protein Ddye_025252 [Dipteronia dyeriana]|uniref:Uncharacterized protein n=1 Tax=Dipteronia dyeriana TaxID=168575 RepID=A0AAD9TXE0_9ROSI|nr:hypothetical protein Ddye_025252 [Dipteronia dyeriana]
MKLRAAIDIDEENRGISNAMIDIEKLATSLRVELGSLYPLSDQYNSIYRVSKRLRESNEKAYTPQVVSIGPLHYGTKKLIPMEDDTSKIFFEEQRQTLLIMW